MNPDAPTVRLVSTSERRSRRSRRTRPCTCCRGTIRAGEVYVHAFVVVDGRAEGADLHPWNGACAQETRR